MMKSKSEFDDAPRRPDAAAETAPWEPAWFGSLGAYAANVEEHSMHAVKRSIASARATERFG